MSPEDGSDEPGTADVPVEGASTTPAPWDPPQWPGYPQEPWATTQIPPHEWAVPEPPKRAWLRRTLVSLVALLTVTGLVLGSLAYLDHRQEVKERKAEAARVAAEKKAAAAYVAAVKPLALKVFDAVQPIQDVYDAYARPRPGLADARDDVIQHGGSQRELKAITVALQRLRAPSIYITASSDLSQGLQRLVEAMTGLERASHAKPDSHGYIASFGPAFESLLSAELLWGAAVRGVDSDGAWPVPNENRKQARGRHVPTAASFIMASDLACGKALAAAEFEPYRTPAQAVRTLGKLSKATKSAIVALKAAPYPTTQRPFRHRLEIGWSATLVWVGDMDRMVAAYHRHDQVALLKAWKRFRDDVDGIEDLGRAYAAQGISACGLFFSDSDSSSKSSPGLRA